MKEFNRWSPSEEDQKDLNPGKARDIIIKCFLEAQKETFARAKEKLHMSVSDEELKKSVTAAVRMTFKECGGDFENPDRKCLEKVVEDLAGKAASWKTPEDVIERHRKIIMGILEKI